MTGEGDVKRDIIRELPLSDRVGFDTLPYQYVKKCAEEVFVFNIMCVGETGIGKTSLIASLFNIPFNDSHSNHNFPEVKLKTETHILTEKNIKLKLTVVETMGYGDQINKENNFKPIVDYLDSQFENFLQEEMKFKRAMSSVKDTMVHACLYFICPTGHNLKSTDLICLKSLHQKVNIIPVIAKADSVSKDELKRFKENIRKELSKDNIAIYSCPTDDESTAQINAALNDLMPFAVVGSQDFAMVDGKMARVRGYPWGTICINNEEHSDFPKLKEMLIMTNMEDLREQTHKRHYERYRAISLEKIGFCYWENDGKPFNLRDIYEKKRDELQKEMNDKETKIKEAFAQKVKRMEAKLKEEEWAMHSRNKQISMQLELEMKKLEEDRRCLELEIAAFQVKKQKSFLKTGKSGV
ncbi:septin-2-like [Stegodyphus dumicola]|uniref:septin-2-like n=1 Tax=Stegodyphus dumicola TaxID=202533 RepID=UPI0015AEBA5F|nr:septin-2-like [Stegodyphus dumicola]